MTDRTSSRAPRAADDAASGGAESIDRLLDAAFDQFRLLGIRRSSMDDIARRAGIGRATLYRRFENKDVLVSALLEREVSRMVAEVEAAMASVEDPEERVVEAFVTGIRLTRRQPLLRALLAIEPDTILPSLTTNAGMQHAIVRTALAEQIRRARLLGQPVGEVADDVHVAEFVGRVAHSLVLSPETALPLDDDEQARRFARLTIVPLVFARSSNRVNERSNR